MSGDGSAVYIPVVGLAGNNHPVEDNPVEGHS